MLEVLKIIWNQLHVATDFRLILFDHITNKIHHHTDVPNKSALTVKKKKKLSEYTRLV